MKTRTAKLLSALLIFTFVLSPLGFAENLLNEVLDTVPSEELRISDEIELSCENDIVVAADTDPIAEEMEELDLPFEDDPMPESDTTEESTEPHVIDPVVLDQEPIADDCVAENSEVHFGDILLEDQPVIDYQSSDNLLMEGDTLETQIIPNQGEGEYGTEENSRNEEQFEAELSEFTQTDSQSQEATQDDTANAQDTSIIQETQDSHIASEAVDTSDKTLSMEEDNDGRTINFTRNTSITCNLGESIWLTYNGKEDASYITSAKIYNRKIVSDGEIDYNSVHLKMDNVGKTKVKITRTNGKKYTIKIKVVDPNEPTSVEIWIYPSKVNKRSIVPISLGSGDQLDAFQYRNGKQVDNAHEVTWKSSNNKVVSIDNTGWIVAKRTGKAKITVRTYNGKKTYIYLKVARNKIDNINKKPRSSYIKRNYKNDCGIILKSIEYDVNPQQLIVEAYAVNGTNKTKDVTYYDMQVCCGNTTLAACEVSISNVKPYGCKEFTLRLNPGTYLVDHNCFYEDKVDECDLIHMYMYNKSHYGFSIVEEAC